MLHSWRRLEGYLLFQLNGIAGRVDHDILFSVAEAEVLVRPAHENALADAEALQRGVCLDV